MVDLRAKLESALGTTLEKYFSLPIKLVGPDGVIQHGLRGQVIYYTKTFSAEIGADILIKKPNVTLRRSSLDPVPQNGEKWIIYIPDEPREDSETTPFSVEMPIHDGQSFGWITLYGTKTDQVMP